MAAAIQLIGRSHDRSINQEKGAMLTNLPECLSLMDNCLEAMRIMNVSILLYSFLRKSKWKKFHCQIGNKVMI